MPADEEDTDNIVARANRPGDGVSHAHPLGERVRGLAVAGSRVDEEAPLLERAPHDSLAWRHREGPEVFLPESQRGTGHEEALTRFDEQQHRTLGDEQPRR